MENKKENHNIKSEKCGGLTVTKSSPGKMVNLFLEKTRNFKSYISGKNDVICLTCLNGLQEDRSD